MLQTGTKEIKTNEELKRMIDMIDMYLMFEESDIVFINNLYNSIYLKELEIYITNDEIVDY